jgi:hypothetical protein
MKRITVLVCAALALAIQPMRAAEPKALVLTQAESPVVITKYQTRYTRSDKATELGINHRLDYKNRTDRRILAIEFGFVEFTVWNEHIETLIANDLDEVGGGKSGDGSWLHDPATGFLFHTGIAYVSRVRFEDGEIWTANPDDIVEHIRGVEASFSAEMLKPKGS